MQPQSQKGFAKSTDEHPTIRGRKNAHKKVGDLDTGKQKMRLTKDARNDRVGGVMCRAITGLIRPTKTVVTLQKTAH